MLVLDLDIARSQDKQQVPKDVARPAVLAVKWSADILGRIRHNSPRIRTSVIYFEPRRVDYWDAFEYWVLSCDCPPRLPMPAKQDYLNRDNEQGIYTRPTSTDEV